MVSTVKVRHRQTWAYNAILQGLGASILCYHQVSVQHKSERTYTV
jgi:hypothetical protein